MSGADFIEKYVGTGAARIRDLFERARRAAPSIVFIDEIDAVGRERSTDPSGGNDEAARTLNALLVEMDGFREGKDPVVVLAATNRPDILDKALTRPGRFDRKIHIPLPDLEGRIRILRAHLAGKPLHREADVEGLARRCRGLSGADLAFIANEAALAAARAGAPRITSEHLDQALMVATLGRARRSFHRTEDEARLVAFHEAGHAVLALACDQVEDPVSVSIVPRGQAGGATWVPDREGGLMTRRAAMQRLIVLMGGRAAEESLLGGDWTSGSSVDLQEAKRLAHDMVASWGMGAQAGRPRPVRPGCGRRGGRACVGGAGLGQGDGGGPPGRRREDGSPSVGEGDP